MRTMVCGPSEADIGGIYSVEGYTAVLHQKPIDSMPRRLTCWSHMARTCHSAYVDSSEVYEGSLARTVS